MSAQHTPTPWHLQAGIRDGQGQLLFSSCGSPIIGEEDLANAAFIVLAVNSHEALVEAIQKARKALHERYVVLDKEFLDALITLDNTIEAIDRVEGKTA